MCREDLELEYKEMAALITYAEIQMFEQGGHPAIASNAGKAAEIIRDFIRKKQR